MQFNETFGECLTKLLRIMGMKGSVLAKGINVDPSLVYKWLRNERVPSYSSPHIDSITDFFMKCIINSFQRTKIINELKEYRFEIPGDDPKSFQSALRKYLLESQGYSIEVSINNTVSDKEKFQPKVKDLVKPMGIPSDMINNSKFQTNEDNNNVIELSEVGFLHNPSFGYDKVKVIRGNKEVSNYVLALLQSAIDKPDSKNDIIIITLSNSTNQLYDYREYVMQLKHTLLEILSKGWTVILLIRLNIDRKTMIKVIEIFQSVFPMGKLNIYFYKNNDVSIHDELFIVPKKGALYCFSSELINQLDSAFLFRSKQSIILLTKHYMQFLTAAKPLLHEYPYYAKAEFQLKITESEENLGNRYYFSGGISTVTIPINLYEKYLNMSRISKNEALLFLDCHRRRLAAFKAQIRYYRYKDIWLREAVEMLVSEKKYSFSKNHILENCVPNNKDIICHLENIVNMLEAYENYEVALVTKNDYKDACRMCWMVKENSSAFIKAIKTNTQKSISCDYSDSGINALVTEKEVISAYQEYFISIWNKIYYNKIRKKELVKWLRNQIASFKKKVM